MSCYSLARCGLMFSLYSWAGQQCLIVGRGGGAGAQPVSSYMLDPSGSNRPMMPHAAAIYSKHDPSPLIILSGGRSKDSREVKRQEGRGEEKTWLNKKEGSKTIKSPEGALFCCTCVSLVRSVVALCHFCYCHLKRLHLKTLKP